MFNNTYRWIYLAGLGAEERDTLLGWVRGGQGLAVRVKEVPFGLTLFKLVATNGDIEWVITNHVAAHLSREMVIDAVKVRWQVEEFHRSFKQLT